jgi:hypothetical protein
MRRRLLWIVPAAATAVLAGGLVLAPGASAASGGAILPVAFLGLPSLHSIIEGIAKGFFGALAHALVPSWLTHGTVATIQHLVALPDPARWTHVGQLQGDMVYLGAMLLPVTLAVSTVRYWLVGFTGAAHPVGAVGRCVWVTFVLVAYRWFIEQAVAGTNTLTHAILGFPVVADGLQRIIGVLFGGALLSGAGGVFGAFLVIIGVLFAAGLFAVQVLLTVLLALLIVAGPPLIALSAIPELAHLARTWAHALMAITLVPLGWTVLFATAGALCLDATSFTGGAGGGVPGHIAAAFAGLITFALAVKLPLMLLGEMRHLFGAGLSGGGGSSGQSTMPGAEQVRSAHARLRSAAFEGGPSLGRSAGRAAGALGAPAGGPLGAARRGLAGAARCSGTLPGAAAGAAGGALAGRAARRGVGSNGRRGVRERLRNAGVILANAPREARAAMTAGSRKASRSAARASSARAATRGGGRASAASNTGKSPVSVAAGSAGGSRADGRGAGGSQRSSGGVSSRPATPPTRTPSPRSAPAASALARTGRATPIQAAAAHPGRKVTANAQREVAGGASKPAAARPREQRSKPPGPPPVPPRAQRPDRRSPQRNPRPRSGS